MTKNKLTTIILYLIDKCYEVVSKETDGNGYTTSSTFNVNFDTGIITVITKDNQGETWNDTYSVKHLEDNTTEFTVKDLNHVVKGIFSEDMYDPMIKFVIKNIFKNPNMDDEDLYYLVSKVKGELEE